MKWGGLSRRKLRSDRKPYREKQLESTIPWSKKAESDNNSRTTRQVGSDRAGFFSSPARWLWPQLHHGGSTLETMNPQTMPRLRGIWILGALESVGPSAISIRESKTTSSWKHAHRAWNL